jgi:hypothetical protein
VLSPSVAGIPHLPSIAKFFSPHLFKNIANGLQDTVAGALTKTFASVLPRIGLPRSCAPRRHPITERPLKSDDTANIDTFGCQHPPQSAMPFCDATQPIRLRVKDLIGRLTLEEKVGQLSHGGAYKNGPAPAIARLGVAAWQWGTECLSGDVWAGPATSFPQSLTLASSFDLDLAIRVANATGAEVRAKNNDVVSRNIHTYHTGLSCWSPVLNIARHPLWGRNQETYGECADPTRVCVCAALCMTARMARSTQVLS